MTFTLPDENKESKPSNQFCALKLTLILLWGLLPSKPTGLISLMYASNSNCPAFESHLTLKMNAHCCKCSQNLQPLAQAKNISCQVVPFLLFYFYLLINLGTLMRLDRVMLKIHGLRTSKPFFYTRLVYDERDIRNCKLVNLCSCHFF